MTPQQRVEAALDLSRQGWTRLRDWADEPDPVAQRKLQTSAATLFRSAADFLDDEGRMQETPA